MSESNHLQPIAEIRKHYVSTETCEWHATNRAIVDAWNAAANLRKCLDELQRLSRF